MQERTAGALATHKERSNADQSGMRALRLTPRSGGKGGGVCGLRVGPPREGTNLPFAGVNRAGKGGGWEFGPGLNAGPFQSK